MIRALDLSSFQGAPDWAAIKQDGVELVILKSSEGTSASLSAWFHQAAPAAIAAGLQVAAYHFAWTPGNPADQAAWMLGITSALPADTVVLSNGVRLPARWLDLESGTGDLTGWASTFLAAVRRPVGFYSYGPFVRQHISPGAALLGGYPLWLAAYQTAVPAAVAPWTEVTLWQNSSSAAVPGVLGRVDSDFVIQGPPPAAPGSEDDMSAIFHNDDDARRCWVREQVNRYWHREPTMDELNMLVWVLATGPTADAVLASIIDSPNTVR